MLFRRAITRRGWFLCEPANLVWPLGFSANSQLGQRLNSITNKRAAVLIDCAFYHAFVVIDEQATEIDERRTVFDFQELECADQSISSATTKLSLVFNR